MKRKIEKKKQARILHGKPFSKSGKGKTTVPHQTIFPLSISMLGT